jgi:CHRD domain-containing protein/PEP-CTERM motif-containing protein
MEILGQNVPTFGVEEVDMKRSLSVIPKLLVIALAIATALTLSVPAAYAVPITFVANLSATNEVPPVPSPGTGFATVVLDPTAQTIQINATFSGLTSNVVAAHIHCCAPLGTNAGVATTVPAFPGFPLGVTNGNYSSAVFDLTQSTIYNPAFVTLQGGTIPGAEAAFIAGIQNGLTYLNIHTVNNGGGEIRGQLLPIPEPSTFLLLGSGLAGLLLWRKRTP